MTLKKLVSFVIKNYFIAVFVGIVFLVGLAAGYKLFLGRSTYVYTKVKLGQGLWWATTAKPSIWFVRSIKKGDIQRDLLGKPVAEILNVRYYPYITNFDNPGSQYDVYITMRLKVDKNKKSGTYNFNRSTMGVGSAVDFEFPSSQFSGTVTDVSESPFIEKYVEKVVYLTKKNAYPWEFDAITPGDSYFDGEQTVFQVLDKRSSDTYLISPDLFGNVSPDTTETRKYIIVRATMKLKLEDGNFLFGEDQVVTPGKVINLTTSHFTFANFVVGGIQ